MDLGKLRAEYLARLEASLRKAVAVLSALPGVRGILLFGSYARGQRDLFTDLDLIVIMESDEDFLSRTARVYEYLDFPVDADVLVYTPEEFAALRERPFFRRALREGKVLHEKGRVF